MSVHFDFVVSDEDAETIMGCIQDAIDNYLDRVLIYKNIKLWKSEINKEAAEEMKTLKEKMTNTKVEK